MLGEEVEPSSPTLFVISKHERTRAGLEFEPVLQKHLWGIFFSPCTLETRKLRLTRQKVTQQWPRFSFTCRSWVIPLPVTLGENSWWVGFLGCMLVCYRAKRARGSWGQLPSITTVGLPGSDSDTVRVKKKVVSHSPFKLHKGKYRFKKNLIHDNMERRLGTVHSMPGGS